MEAWEFGTFMAWPGQNNVFFLHFFSNLKTKPISSNRHNVAIEQNWESCCLIKSKRKLTFLTKSQSQKTKS